MLRDEDPLEPAHKILEKQCEQAMHASLRTRANRERFAAGVYGKTAGTSIVDSTSSSDRAAGGTGAFSEKEADEHRQIVPVLGQGGPAVLVPAAVEQEQEQQLEAPYTVQLQHAIPSDVQCAAQTMHQEEKIFHRHPASLHLCISTPPRLCL